jgi:mannose-6-phosphate isomerase-like protein (cupin superfamily)
VDGDLERGKQARRRAAVREARYGIDAYLEWVRHEGIRTHEGIALNMMEADVGDWPRYGVKGAAVHFKGAGDYCNMFALEIPAGGSTTPQRHLYEEIYYVLDGRGSTQLTIDGAKRSFEWGPRSLFAIPLNVEHRHFNASGTQRARFAVTTTLPMMMKIFHDESVIFNAPFEFPDRVGKEEYYTGGGDLDLIRPGNNVWETNFVPDLAAVELTEWSDRGRGSSNMLFALGNGIMHAHISEIAAATYKKAHRHEAGFLVLTLTGDGYTLLWEEYGKAFTRVDWAHGVVIPPCEGQFHQHFVTSNTASRYMATGLGSLRYPFTESFRELTLGGRNGKPQAVSRSVKEGGNQIEYEDQDPSVHAMWLEELKKHGVKPSFGPPVLQALRASS